MDVRINETREYQLAGGVNHLSIRRRIQVRANAGDGLIFRVDIGMIAGICCNYFAVLN